MFNADERPRSAAVPEEPARAASSHRIESVEALESVIGPIPPIMKSKPVRTLDGSCAKILSLSGLAALGLRDQSGPRTTLVGGARGFARIESPTQLGFDLSGVTPLDGDGASLLFLIAGVGETLRVNGTLTTRDGRATFLVNEAFVHCARAILRSRLWSHVDSEASTRSLREFVSVSPFLFLSSWAADRSSDTSPRGDPPGVLRMFDERTLVLPDRRGNDRTDTLHNVMGDPRVSLLAVVPGRSEVLEVMARSEVVTEPALLASFALGPSAPKTALLLRVERAEIRQCAVLQEARPWDPATHISREEAPNMMALGAAMTVNQRSWLGLFLRPLLLLFRWIATPLFAFLYRKNLRDEGYGEPREAKVVEVRRETDEVVSLWLEDRSGDGFVFKPGQFFGVTAKVDGKRVRRSYSVACAPGRLLRMTIKRTGGVFSTWANDSAKPGDVLTLTGPSGAFCLTPKRRLRRELVLIAAGSGITPVMSIALALIAQEPKTRVTLLYGNRRLPDVIYLAELTALEQQHGSRFKVRHVLTVPPEDWKGGRGRLDEIGLPRELGLLRPSAKAEYYVCGPEPMLASVRVALRSLGVPDQRVHEERFAAPKLLVSTAPREMTVFRGDEAIGSVTVAADQTILEAGLSAGLPLAFSCGSGACGECRVKLRRGEVVMAEPNSLPSEDRANGAILACVARPLSAIEVTLDKSDP